MVSGRTQALTGRVEQVLILFSVRMALGAALLGWAVTAAGEQAQASAPWWDGAWKFRQTVRLITPPLASGINTILAEIDPMGKAHPDGRDVRVVTPTKLVLPHQVEKAEGGRLKVYFQAPSDNQDTFYIYYGNPSAPAAEGQWEKRLGGLTLETRALIPRRPAFNWEQVQELLAAQTQVFGRGPRPCINDSRNPYGPQDSFCAIYKGKIFCPESGVYHFATNSDDGSYLFIDGRMVCQWPGAHDAEVTFEKVKFEEARGSIELQKGIHSIEYYLIQHFGAAQARAGWKKPGDRDYSIIPPSAFPQTLLAGVTAYQEYQKNVSAFFTSEMVRKLSFNKADRVFARIAFHDCSTSLLGNPVSWRWDFGDGATSSEQNPFHEFTATGEYTVRLEVRDGLGYAGQVARSVKVTGDEAQRVTVFFDTEQEENVLYPLEDLSVTLRFGCSYPFPLPLVLRSTVRLQDERLVQEESDALQLVRDAWRTLRKKFPSRPGANTVTFSLQYLGVPVAESVVRILPTSTRIGSLNVLNNSLVDQKGNIVVLRLRDFEGQRVPERLTEKLVEGKACKIVIVEDSLSPPPGAGGGGTLPAASGLYAILKKSLEDRFPGQRFELVRAGLLDQSAVYPPLARLAGLEREVIAAQPDFVIWSCSLMDVLNYVPIETFDRYLKAGVEEILGQTNAGLLLVSAPPVVVNPEMGYGYAVAMKKVGLRYGIPMLDLFSTFCRMGENWKALFQEGWNSADPVFSLYPNVAGQELIARRIFEKMMESR